MLHLGDLASREPSAAGLDDVPDLAKDDAGSTDVVPGPENPFDEGIAQGLDEFVARRRRELPDEAFREAY